MCPCHVVGNAPLVGAQGIEPRSNRAPAHREDQSQAPVSIRAHRHYERRPGSQRPPVSVHCGWQLRTPGWIRTSGFDTRNVALFPLSYEGMSWTVGELNPAHQACKARLCTSTQPISIVCVPPPGFEPGPSASSTPCLCRWTTRVYLCERTAGIEPAFSVWKTDVSNQPHQIRVAADAGLEPALSDRESEGLPITESAVRPGPENRTRCVLFPKQAGQPAPSPRNDAIHCGVLNVHAPPARRGGCALNTTKTAPGRCSGGGVCATRWVRLYATPARDGLHEGQFEWHDRETARRSPLRFPGVPLPQHGVPSSGDLPSSTVRPATGRSNGLFGHGTMSLRPHLVWA